MQLSDLYPQSLTFIDSLRNHSHGQSDMTLSALVGKTEAGRIDYSIYQGNPSIQYIEVKEKFRGNNRRGIGSALVKHLQSLFPDKEIEWGTMTPDGKALYDSLPKKVIYNPKYQEYLDALEKIKKLEVKYTNIFEHKATTPEKKLELGKKWNQLHDLEYTYREKIRHLSKSTTLIVI